jgi:acetyl-CoA carboxylase carboxyl transferase subunit alpha
MGMRITAQDLMKFGIIDAIVKEPVGGAHRDGIATMQAAGDAIEAAFAELSTLSPEAVRQARRAKFLAIGRDLKP